MAEPVLREVDFRSKAKEKLCVKWEKLFDKRQQNSALFAQVRDVEIGSEFGGAFHAEIDAPGRWFWKDQLAELCAFFKEPIAKGAGRSQVVATQIEEIPYVMVAQAALMLQFLCFTHAFIIA